MGLGATDSGGPSECSKIVFIMTGTLIKMSKKVEWTFFFSLGLARVTGNPNTVTCWKPSCQYCKNTRKHRMHTGNDSNMNALIDS